ncbi:hypothetical protein F4778DRAFT_793699 [Xylariomycetidae sp. FL2044]|nr:hypothetical protein F4778DRAFT_793699 [Xylariomycetidae sp. FL2044]
MQSSRTCLRCWKPAFILASKLLIFPIVCCFLSTAFDVPWLLRCLFWLVYPTTFYLITANFYFTWARPIWFDETSPEEHTHIRPGYIGDKLQQEIWWQSQLIYCEANLGAENFGDPSWEGKGYFQTRQNADSELCESNHPFLALDDDMEGQTTPSGL